MSGKISSRSPHANGYKKSGRGPSTSRSLSYDSRSRSGSYRSYSKSYSKSRSRSSSYDRDRHRRHPHGRERSTDRRRTFRPMRSENPDEPAPCKCLGVFGLSLYTQERDLRDIFSKYGGVQDVVIVYDHATRRSRGFGFVYFETVDDAAYAKEKCTGLEIDGRRIRVDFSVTKRAHTPTPGIYMGKPTYGPGYSRKRTPSPYYGRGKGSHSRHSRSRSYSPTNLMKFEEYLRKSINCQIKIEI